MPSIQTSENRLTSVARNKRHEKQLCPVMAVEDAGPVAVESQSVSYTTTKKLQHVLVDSQTVRHRTLHSSFCV